MNERGFCIFVWEFLWLNKLQSRIMVDDDGQNGFPLMFVSIPFISSHPYSLHSLLARYCHVWEGWGDGCINFVEPLSQMLTFYMYICSSYIYIYIEKVYILWPRQSHFTFTFSLTHSYFNVTCVMWACPLVLSFVNKLRSFTLRIHDVFSIPEV